MHAQQWLEAWRSGAVVHDWTEIEITDGKNVARVKVSADSARVQHPGGERVREGAGGYAVQQVADALGGLMTTARLLELRHLAGTVVLEPLLGPWIEKGGGTAETTPREASLALDEMIQRARPFESWGAAPSQARQGPWLVVNGCKPFVLDERCTDRWGVNHGWIVAKDQCAFENGKWWWTRSAARREAGELPPGVRVYPCVSPELADFMLVQHRGRAHTIGATGADQDDYASHVVCVHGESWLNGQAGIRTEVLFTTRELCGLVAHDSRPFASARHPGVPLVVASRHEDPPPGAERAPARRGTDPSTPLPWLDPDLTHGERKVVWLEAQRGRGVREVPDGSNNGPDIKTYHAITQRDGQPGFGSWLARAGGNWCASSASKADLVTRLEVDPEPFMTPRASGWEIERDARADGSWRPVELVLQGKFEPEPGDVATMQRGEPGSGKRHVVTVKQSLPERKGCICIGGNEGNRFGDDRFRKWSSLLGFRELPDPVGARYDGPTPYQGEDVEVEQPDMLDDGDNVLEPGWGPMVPDGWAPTEFRGVEGAENHWKTVNGILVRGEASARRTKGKPVTAGKVWDRYSEHVLEAHELTDVPVANILAMLMTESGLLPPEELERFEKHLGDWSFGVAQTLTATAFAMARQLDITAPRKPVPQGGSEDEWRAFLGDPRNSVLIAAAYMAYNDERWRLLDDPVLAYAAYNAGSPRVNLDRSWGVHYYRHEGEGGVYDAMDTFAAWYGDACAVLG